MLYIVQAVCCLLPLAFLWVLPSRQEVEECQAKLKQEEKEAGEQEVSAP